MKKTMFKICSVMLSAFLGIGTLVVSIINKDKNTTKNKSIISKLWVAPTEHSVNSINLTC
jgi:hypothetical protein